MKVLSLLKYVFSLIGLLVLLGAYFSYNITRDFLGASVTALGEIVDLFPKKSENSIVFSPVIEFVSQEGETVEFTYYIASNLEAYALGDKVEVVYSVLNPEREKINDFFDLWGSFVILAILGGCFFLSARLCSAAAFSRGATVSICSSTALLCRPNCKPLSLINALA